MTDRTPDDLYDALRDRLADYGQEPPAPLWAKIRAQLPPPVAAPQLRRRRRRPIVLLGLLLTVLSAAGWQLWLVSRSGPAVMPAPQTVALGSNAPTNAAVASPASAGPSASPKLGKAALENPGMSGASISETKSSPSTATTDNLRLATQVRPDSAASRRSGPYRPQPAGSVAGPFAGGSQARNPRLAVLSRSARVRYSAGQPSLAVGSTDSSVELPTAAAFSTSGSEQGRLPVDVVVAPSAGGHKAVERSTAPVFGPVAASATDYAPGAPASLLASRPVAVLSPALPQPRVQLRTDTFSTAPAVVRRWTVQVLAGPTLTHQHLGAEPASDPSLPTGIITYLDSIVNEFSRRERMSTGYSAQVQVRRVLTGRWSLSTGLGYQEYASQTTYVASTSTSTPPILSSGVFDMAPPSPHRSTYRFLTVPIRFGYALGQSGGRLRYGLLAGIDAALYLGGNSAGKEAVPTAWSISGSPYRPLSASVSLGLDFRYRLASHLEVLAQPTATYFLNSLPRPLSGLTPHHLFGAGALLGLSYEFR
ncbi:outer membrane beta-barrel protein [Hymenobacter sp. BT664]|uniref:Outer membrane beta-barrel protein n=1 Tax=Hymenobacter montanus TaxID=2771359 RepID=A0A927GJL3_9BACT|nr:outer membrane beta-barrel protein [Hymenobacter montanus]MBD2768608.1 outer membrane beta-barrel protein [Hymenobacter montanus]